MKYQNLNLKTNNNTSIIKINNQQIEVKQYLPVSDKIDLIQIALQKAEETDGYFDQIKLDMYFHLNIVYLYTNIEFSEEDRQDEMKLYDILETNDVILNVIGAMDEKEYEILVDYAGKIKEELMKYKNSAAGVIKHIVTDLPKNAAVAKQIVESFDPSQYQAVVDFATAANGGRNINTNKNVKSIEQEKQTKQPITNDHKPPKRRIVSVSSAKKKD